MEDHSKALIDGALQTRRQLTGMRGQETTIEVQKLEHFDNRISERAGFNLVQAFRNRISLMRLQEHLHRAGSSLNFLFADEQDQSECKRGAVTGDLFLCRFNLGFS